MSRWKRHSLDGLRVPLAAPDSSTATMSSTVVSAYGSPLGVIRKPPSMRALTLPDLPRLIPAAFIARAVAMIAVRSAGVSAGIAASVHVAQRIRTHRYASLGDVAGHEARGRHVEREIHGGRTARRNRHARGCAPMVASDDMQHLLRCARFDRNRIARG